MVLEAIMICVDNSEWSRNGDYVPSRFGAQVESINQIASQKIISNPETTVGLLSMAGGRIDVHISPTRSTGSIMTALAKSVNIKGESNFLAALKTAALALKNRQNKNQRQRIVMFVGSPLTHIPMADLVKLGKQLKKNAVAVDVINFGTENASNDNVEKLEQFIAAVNSSAAAGSSGGGGVEASHLVNIPPGPHRLSDLLISSPIMDGSGGGGGGDGGAIGGGGGGGIAAGGLGGRSGGGGGGDFDANEDPEMAMAIRMSMEEERLRQQRATASTTAPAPAAVAAPSASESIPMEEDEEALLAQAIALSMSQHVEGAMEPAAPPAAAPSVSSGVPGGIEAPGPGPSATSASGTDNADINQALQDPDFINSLLASVGASGSADGTGDVREASGGPTADVQLDSLLDQLTSGTGGTAPAPERKTDGGEKDQEKDKEKK